ncbi:HK97-gp10 family putative phage morphogenesis protein [Dermabacteraceae bacterium P7006]
MSGADDMNQLARDLAKAIPTFDARARVVVQKACAEIKARAQAVVPVSPGGGTLKRSISYRTSKAPGGATGEVGPTAHYGAYVELGTYKMAARPYLRPATDQVTPSFNEAAAKLSEDIL